jgi:hypothetical protein
VTKRPRRRSSTASGSGRRRRVAPLDPDQLDALRTELEKAVTEHRPARWNADPSDVQRSVLKLVLSLVEFLRKLMERQALRRIENHTLTPEEIENIGLALMKLEQTVRDLAAQFDIDPDDLNLDLGPIGRLS